MKSMLWMPFKKGGMGYLLKPVEDVELKKNFTKNIFLYKERKS